MSPRKWPLHCWCLVLAWTGWFLFTNVPNKFTKPEHIEILSEDPVELPPITTAIGFPVSSITFRSGGSTTGSVERINIIALLMNIGFFLTNIACIFYLTICWAPKLKIREIAVMVLALSLLVIFFQNLSANYEYEKIWAGIHAIYFMPALFTTFTYGHQLLHQKQLSATEKST